MQQISIVLCMLQKINFEHFEVNSRKIRHLTSLIADPPKKIHQNFNQSIQFKLMVMNFQHKKVNN